MFISTPITVLSENTSLWIMVSVTYVRLGRFNTSFVRYAVPVELPIVKGFRADTKKNKRLG